MEYLEKLEILEREFDGKTFFKKRVRVLVMQMSRGNK